LEKISKFCPSRTAASSCNAWLPLIRPLLDVLDFVFPYHWKLWTHIKIMTSKGNQVSHHL
jgi:hypothetical protein